MRKVFYYKHNGFVPVEDFINKSDEKVKKKFLFCVGYILGEPGVLSEPYVKHISLSSRMYEMRFKASGKLIRILFYEEDSNVYLLHAFYKKDRHDTDKNLACAEKALARFMSERNAKHIAV